MTRFDVIIIGAGAAGMLCAATAGQRGRRVLLVDHATRLAEKIRISGGGRCNFTNLHCRPEAFLSQNPHFARSALSRYTQQDFIKLVERHGIAWHEKTLGQLFCDDSAKQIIQMLKTECDRGGVQWAMPATVECVERVEDSSHSTPANIRFRVFTSAGAFSCESLVVATGGLSIPKIGATPLGYRIAEQFGIGIVPPKPALVPLALPPEWLAQFGQISGASFDTLASVEPVVEKVAEKLANDARMQSNVMGSGVSDTAASSSASSTSSAASAKRSAGKSPRRGAVESPAFRESALITHRGLSGPAILQVSSYWQQAGGRGAIALNLMPGVDVAAWIAPHRHTRSTLGQLLTTALPKRIAEQFALAHGWSQPLAECSNVVVQRMVDTLTHWRVQPSGTLGYEKAEVTLGGVDTQALSQQTMEARTVPGLHFVGEVVDVTGWLGGYNFQWAWSSAVVAGEVV